LLENKIVGNCQVPHDECCRKRLWAEIGNGVKGDRGKGMAILVKMGVGWDLLLPILALGANRQDIQIFT